MFFYIYDSFLADKKYEKILGKIEIRLTNLGIAGRNIRLSILKNVEEIVKDLPEKDSPTIVIIGEDKTFFKAAKALVGKRTPIGFIPIRGNSIVAKLLGLPINEFACDVVSARLIETINLGKVNPVRSKTPVVSADTETYRTSNGVNKETFFSFLEIPAKDVIITCDHQYLIRTNKLKKVRIFNLGLLQFGDSFRETEEKKMIANPKDKYLEILIGNPSERFLFWRKKEKLDSLFFAEKIDIISKKRNKKIPIIVDGEKIIELPVSIGLSRELIRVVVGRNRLI